MGGSQSSYNLKKVKVVNRNQVPEKITFFFFFKTSHPQTGSLTGSPHLSELSVNSQGGVAPAHVTLSPNLSPDTKQTSPLISPLLNDQACPRTDDEDEGRRKVRGRGLTRVCDCVHVCVCV